MKYKKLTNRNLNGASGGAMDLGAVQIQNANNVMLSDGSSSSKSRDVSATNIDRLDRKHTNIGIDVSGVTSAVSSYFNPAGAAASAIGGAIGGYIGSKNNEGE